MIVREGFAAFGLDLSWESFRLGKRMLGHWKAEAELQAGNMTTLPYRSDAFDAVLDVFSSYCLTMVEFRKCLREVARVLKSGGSFFFLYTGQGQRRVPAPSPRNPARCINVERCLSRWFALLGESLSVPIRSSRGVQESLGMPWV